MTSISVGRGELERRTLTLGHLDKALEALQHDGCVILEDIVSQDHLETLRDKMMGDIAALVARKDAPYNWNTGNLQQNPPPFPPYLFRDVLVNDIVIQVTKSVLGSGMQNMLYSGNTALTSEERQPVHADIGQLWPGLTEAHPAFGIVVNVPLVDVHPENGGTEIWPGTHRDTSVVFQDEEIKVSPQALERWRAISPPYQLEMRAGSVLIRDMRLWHAGMPNRTSEPRPMIAMCHFVKWWTAMPRLRFPKGCESVLEHPDLVTHADFVDESIDHIAAPVAYEYQTS